MFQDATQQGMEMGVRMAWDRFFSPLLKEHWLAVILVTVSLFVFAIIKAKMGQWGSLGSFLYWFFYAMFVLPICWFWDPAILVSDVYHMLYLLALWPLCYWLSGRIMYLIGVGPHHHSGW